MECPYVKYLSLPHYSAVKDQFLSDVIYSFCEAGRGNFKICSKATGKKILAVQEKYRCEKPIFRGNDFFSHVRSRKELINYDVLHWYKIMYFRHGAFLLGLKINFFKGQEIGGKGKILRINLGIVLDVVFPYTYLVSERPFLNIIQKEVCENETNSKRIDSLGYYSNTREI